MEEVSFKDMISSYDPAVWMGTITFFVILITEAILTGKGLIPSFKDKRMEEARKQGNVILAKRTKYYRDKDSDTRELSYSATYEYE